MVKGTPQALAARASISSAPSAAGADAAGGGDGERQVRRSCRKISTVVSTCETFTSTFGSRRTRSKAARFSRSVVSSSAPPSKKSKMARGRRRFASRRRSSMLTASPKCIIAGHSTFERPNPCHACSLLPSPCCSRCPPHAQNFPSKPLRLICPFPPAGAVDIASRATANELTQDPRPAGRGREQARRRRQPRRRGSGALGARRLHAVHEHQRHPGDQPGALRQDAVRPEQGPDLGRAAGLAQQRAGACTPRCRRRA